MRGGGGSYEVGGFGEEEELGGVREVGGRGEGEGERTFALAATARWKRVVQMERLCVGEGVAANCPTAMRMGAMVVQRGDAQGGDGGAVGGDVICTVSHSRSNDKRRDESEQSGFLPNL